ncbi:MAG: hypothetical protein WA421_12105 [Nitrososphaeraceae archaeon]
MEITTITKPTIQNEEIIEKIIIRYGQSRLKGLLNPISMRYLNIIAEDIVPISLTMFTS